MSALNCKQNSCKYGDYVIPHGWHHCTCSVARCDVCNHLMVKNSCFCGAEANRKTDNRLTCSKGHKKLNVRLLTGDDDEEEWLSITCATCYETVWYNGA